MPGAFLQEAQQGKITPSALDGVYNIHQQRDAAFSQSQMVVIQQQCGQAEAEHDHKIGTHSRVNQSA